MGNPFQTTYRKDRRGHRHRCRACWKVVEPGEQVVMAYLRSGQRQWKRKTWVLHEDCAAKPHECGTWLDAFKAWAA